MATLTQLLQNALENKDPQLPIETKRILLKEALQSCPISKLEQTNLIVLY